MIKNLLAKLETRVRSLGCEDPLEKGMATHNSILAWRIPWTEEPGELQSLGLQRARHGGVTNTHFSTRKNLPCNAGHMGSIPGQKTKILHATEQLSLCTTSRESVP